MPSDLGFVEDQDLGFTPDQMPGTTESESPLGQTSGAITGERPIPRSISTGEYLLGSGAPTAGPFDIAGKFAQFGNWVNQGNQQLAGLSAEKLGQAGVNPYIAAIPGTVLGTLSEMNPLTPTNRLGAYMSMLQPLAAAKSAVSGWAGQLGKEASALSPASETTAASLPSRAAVEFPASGSSLQQIITPEAQSVKTQLGPIAQQWAQAKLDYDDVGMQVYRLEKQAYVQGAEVPSNHPLYQKMDDFGNIFRGIEKQHPELDKMPFDNEDIQFLASKQQNVTQSIQSTPTSQLNPIQQAIGKAYANVTQTLTKPVSDIGSAAIRNMSGVPQKYGAAAIKNPDILLNPPNSQDVNTLYKNFENSTGLINPNLRRALNGELLNSPAGANNAVSEAGTKLAPFIDQEATRSAGNMRIVYDTDKIAQAVKDGTFGKDSMQSLYEGSQGASYLKNLAKMGKPEEAASYNNISNAKDTFDDILELASGGKYTAARQAAFKKATADAFSSFYPLNANQSPNALRGFTGLATAGAAIPTAMATGSLAPLAGLAAPMITAPAFYGGMIRNAASLAQPSTISGLGLIGTGVSNFMSLPVSTSDGASALQGNLTKYSINPMTPQSINRKINDLSNSYKLSK